ncbi:hypothetical protein ACJX0J_028087 [Zea mays]
MDTFPLPVKLLYSWFITFYLLLCIETAMLPSFTYSVSWDLVCLFCLFSSNFDSLMQFNIIEVSILPVMFITLNIFLMFFFVLFFPKHLFFVLLYITMLLTYVHLLIILLYFHDYILHLYSRLKQSLAHVKRMIEDRGEVYPDKSLYIFICIIMWPILTCLGLKDFKVVLTATLIVELPHIRRGGGGGGGGGTG